MKTVQQTGAISKSFTQRAFLLLLLFFFFTLTSKIFAQKFTASTSKSRVLIGETFQISFSLDGNGSNFRPPALNEFEVYSGPNQSTSMSFVNGVMNQSLTLSYVIAAKKEGKFTIAPASVNVSGNTLQSNSMVIEVVKSANSQNSTGSNSNNTSSNESAGESVFVKTSVNKTKVYLGEQITVTHKVYSRFALKGFQDIKYSEYNGFWSQDLPMNNQQIQVTNENIDGVTYQVAVLKHTFIFAQRTGKLEISPMTVSVVVRKQSNRQPRDIFEQFFGGGYEDIAVSAKSKPITIDVNPLPEKNKPSNFLGAVGNYSFKAQVNKEKVKANDAINFTISLTGKGNIKLVDPPKLNLPEDFEVYDPKIKESITVGNDGPNGSKTFEYVAIPRYEGNYKIAPLSFSYFNPESNQYISIPSPEFNIQVEKGDGTVASSKVFSAKAKEDVRILGSDIRFIKTKNINLKSKDNYFFGSGLFYSSLFVPLFAFLFLIIVGKKRIEKNKDIVSVKSRKANKMAQKRLALAAKYLKENKSELFYEEVFKSIYGYLGDKLNIEAVALNKENIFEKLKTKNVNTTSIDSLLNLINNCEFARYAPSAVSSNLNETYNNTVELITKLEDEIS